jgi:hypothetical protein
MQWFKPCREPAASTLLIGPCRKLSELNGTLTEVNGTFERPGGRKLRQGSDMSELPGLENSKRGALGRIASHSCEAVFKSRPSAARQSAWVVV